jgi:nucleoside-diphosphate-sugar epimerase
VLVVTGSAGFIGRHTVAALAADGHTVVGIDRRPADDRHPAEVPLVTDLSAPDDDALAALDEADAVIHLAGRPGVRDAAPDADALRHRDNVDATQRVLDAVRPDATLVVASSSSVYGGAVRDRVGRPVASREDQPLRPRGGYARSKAEVERRCAARRAHGGHVAVVRPFTVAGEGQRPDMALATWLEQARRGQPLRVLGSLERTRDVTDVAAVVHGLRRLLDTGHATTVNLGTGRSVTLAELTHAIADAAGVPWDVEVVPAGAAEVTDTRADTRRVHALLGFVPHTDLAALVRRQTAAATTPVPSSTAHPRSR